MTRQNDKARVTLLGHCWLCTSRWWGGEAGVRCPGRAAAAAGGIWILQVVSREVLPNPEWNKIDARHARRRSLSPKRQVEDYTHGGYAVVTGDVRCRVRSCQIWSAVMTQQRRDLFVSGNAGGARYMAKMPVRGGMRILWERWCRVRYDSICVYKSG